MIKTHNLTGKKYLCKKLTTTDKKAIKYCGSGLIWKPHLKEHGFDFTTEILYKCPESETATFSKISLEYSIKFNIVQSDDWMNMIEEIGQGGSTSRTNGTKGKKWIFKNEIRTIVSPDSVGEYVKNGWSVGYPEHFKRLISKTLKGIVPYNKGKRLKLPHEYVSRISKRKHKLTSPSNYTSERRRETSLKCLNRPEVKLKFQKPRKPPITAFNVETNEQKTLSRKEWWEFDKVSYKRLLRGLTSKGWKCWPDQHSSWLSSAYEAGAYTKI
jgi:hypothetical protein